MKTFEEVQMEMDENERHCLVTIEEFLDWYDCGAVISNDGIGCLHDGDKFVTNGFEVDIFDYIRDLALIMTKAEFIEKYPYVAWYNK